MNFYYSLPDFGFNPQEKGFEPKEELFTKSDYQNQQKALNNLIDDLKNSRNKINRLSAAWQLGKIANAKAANALKDQLFKEKNDDVLSEIVVALGLQKDKFAKAELLRLLYSENSSQIKKRIIWALGQFGCDDDVIEALLVVLKNTKNREIILEILWIFGENKITQSASELKEYYFVKDDWEIKKMIIWALGKIEQKEITNFLINIYPLEKNLEVKKEILWQFGKIQDEKAIEFLFQELSKESIDLQRLIVWAVGEINSPKRALYLIKTISNRELDEQVHREAMWILGKNQILAGKKILLKALADHNRKTKKIAIWALGNIASKNTIKFLEKRLKKEKDWGIQNDIHWAINQIKLTNNYNK